MKKQTTTIIEITREEAQDLMDLIERKLTDLAGQRATGKVTMADFLSQTRKLSDRHKQLDDWVNGLVAPTKPEPVAFSGDERRLLSQYNFSLLDSQTARFDRNNAVIITKANDSEFFLTFNRLNKQTDSLWASLMNFKTLFDKGEIPVVR